MALTGCLTTAAIASGKETLTMTSDGLAKKTSLIQIGKIGGITVNCMKAIGSVQMTMASLQNTQTQLITTDTPTVTMVETMATLMTSSCVTAEKQFLGIG